MAKKVVNIVKKNKDELNNSNEIFNLNEEIIIGVNSKNVVKNNKKKSPKKKKLKKVKQQENKVQSKKNDQPKKKHKLLKFFVITFLIFLSVVLTLLSPLFNIKTIVVKNNNKVSKEQIISLSQIKLDENIFKYININIIENVKENPYIDEVKITRNYPSQIVIEVKERVPEYCLKVGENYAYINTQGYILEVSDVDNDLPELIGCKTELKGIIAGNRLSEEDLLQLEKVNILSNYAKENDVYSQIISYEVGKDRICMGVVGNKTAYIKNFSNVNIKMLSLKSILERTEGKSGKIFLDGQGEENSILFREDV